MTPPLLSQAHLGGIALVEELLDGHLEGPPGEAQHARDPPVVLRLFERLPRRLWLSARGQSSSRAVSVRAPRLEGDTDRRPLCPRRP